MRNKLASTSDSARICRILRKERLTVNKNNLNCNSFNVNELNLFYSTVACAHPPYPLSSLDAIVAPTQDIDDSALSFHEITTAEVYETARMLSSKDRAQTVYLGNILKFYCYYYCLFYLKYLTVRSAQILIQISGREPLLFH